MKKVLLSILCTLMLEAYAIEEMLPFAVRLDNDNNPVEGSSTNLLAHLENHTDDVNVLAEESSINFMDVLVGFFDWEWPTFPTNIFDGWTPVSFSLCPSIAIPWGAVDVRGVQIGLGTQSGDVIGLQIGLLNWADDILGIQTGIYNSSYVAGGGIVGICNVANSATGILVGGICSVHELFGCQVGVVNCASSLTGCQIGLSNTADSVVGCQVGVINHAYRLSGLQIGVINVAENSCSPVLPVVNGNF